MLVCNACRRHFFETASACPFCDAPAPAVRPPHQAHPAGTSRAKRYAVGIALAAGVARAVTVTPASADDAGAAGDSGVAQDDAAAPSPAPTFEPRHQGGGQCTTTGCACNEKTICPPYGCVFPDLSCGAAVI
jgi:hypothetical protein